MSASYPEHEKLSKVGDKSQSIGEFLEWVTQEKGYILAEYGTDEPGDERSPHRLYPVFGRVQSLLAEFFEIDENVLEQEKRAMLEKMREANGA